MHQKLLRVTGLVVALISASCAYDPNYSQSSVSSSYQSGYGHGYGYGGSSFSSSVFVGTGNSRWGYDPYCRSYYDYNRRCYYDPYLHGYYPIGYRPPIVYGVPHPHGWTSGRGHCPPPSRVTTVTISNYRDRESAYRRSNYNWASQVRQQTISTSRPKERQEARKHSTHPNPYFGPSPQQSSSQPFRSQSGRRISSPDPREQAYQGSPDQMRRGQANQPEASVLKSQNQRQQKAPSTKIKPFSQPDEARPPKPSKQNPEGREKTKGENRRDAAAYPSDSSNPRSWG